MSPRSPDDRIHRFFLLTGLWVALQVSSFTALEQYASLSLSLWTLSTTLSYSFFYLLPALITGYLLHALLARHGKRRLARLLLALVLVGTTGVTQALLFADRVIHDMYGFHINGFVADLVFTPGGIESLGASSGTRLTAALIVAGLFALQGATWFWTMRRATGSRRLPAILRPRWILLCLLGMARATRSATATTCRSLSARKRRVPFARQ